MLSLFMNFKYSSLLLCIMTYSLASEMQKGQTKPKEKIILNKKWFAGINLVSFEEVCKMPRTDDCIEAIFENIRLVRANAAIVNLRISYSSISLYLFADFRAAVGLEILREMSEHVIYGQREYLHTNYLFGFFQNDLGFGIDVDPLFFELILLSVIGESCVRSPYHIIVENFVLTFKIKLLKISNSHIFCSLVTRNFDNFGISILIEL